MTIKFSLAQHTVPEWSPEEMIYNACRIGYDMVGIRMIRQGIPGECDYDMVKHPYLAKRAKEALDDTGIQIHDIDLASIGYGRKVSDYAPYLELAQSLGVQGVVSSIWMEEREIYLEEFAKLCDLANSFHLNVYLEFVTWASVYSLRQAKDILDTVRRPNAKILVDSLHYYRSRVQPWELEQCPRQWLDFMHLRDGPMLIPDEKEELIRTGRTQRLYPGEGAADHLGILRNMMEDKVIGLEIPHDLRRKQYGAYEYARRCLEQSNEYLQKNRIM